MTHMNKTETVPEGLRGFFEDNPRLALAFSGGSDSSYLFYAAKACGADVRAYFVKTQFQPRSEMEDAIRTARYLDGDLCIIDRDVLADGRIASNPPDRCYWCKHAVFGAISEAVRKDGRDSVIIDATNASDDPEGRPGMKALKEMGIRSPLRECQISKPEVRELSREAGLWTWNLPSNSCLATRTPFGTVLTEDGLRRTEEAERRVGMLGLSDFRIRTRGDSAFVETREDQMDILDRIRPELESVLSEYYSGIIGYGIRRPGL